METYADHFSMLSWDFVNPSPLTYRSISGAIRFEVTVETDHRKDTIRVTRTEGDKVEIKIFRDCGKALRWCEEHRLAGKAAGDPGPLLN